jgi:SAM-dependent methyltransferase
MTVRTLSLSAYRAEIEAFQRTRPDMDGIRRFNHQMVDVLHTNRSLRGQRLLDLGAAWRGYALERALERGAREYVGVDVVIADPVEVLDGSRRGLLRAMDAEALDFPDASFDCILSVSTFEHFGDGARVLREMARVLAPGGSAFVSFEPVWTCSYGHHLHHIPDVAALVPPWAHLLWTPESMHAALHARWRPELSLTLEQAIDWTYRDRVLNRRPLPEQRALFEQGPLRIAWLAPLRDTPSAGKPELAAYLGRILPWSAEDLMTIGLSILLDKPA